MLHLIYSNRVNELASALCQAVAAGRGGDPFVPVDVIVPDAAVATYLKVAMARERGIAANLRFPFLDSYLARRATQAGARVLDRDQLHALLIGLLGQEALVAGMAPVRAYLDADPSAASLRRFQLAGELATLLFEYRLSRPDLVAAWRAGRAALADTPGARTEVWQRRLWSAVFGEGGAIDQAGDGAPWALLPDAVEACADELLAALPAQLYVFGFASLAPAYQRIFSRLAERCELYLFALNPCREFWEDSAGRGGQAEGEQEALRLWGRPGREHVRSLDELAGFDFAGRFVEPTGDTALARLQRDILERAPAPRDPPLETDDSIRLLACAGPRRELAAIGNEIWRLVRADDSLRFNDVAVLFPAASAELYQAHVAAVFGELHGIPHHMLDAPLAVESRVAEAFELLLALPLGQMTRPDLLRLITHPAVVARFPDVDPDDWIHWTERLGVVHGADRDDHADTYIDRDVFNWDQGLRRLALGAFMSAGRGERAVTFGGADYVPEPLDEDELASAARMALMVRSLLCDARFCRDAHLPLGDWRRLLDLMVQSYLAPESAADERIFDRCRDAVARLADLDLDRRPVNYAIACELVRAQLGQLRGTVGEPLADGVTVAPLAPTRALPYRVIFVAGLGEGEFPGSDRDSPLDLRTAAPRASDIGPRERDRYLFLETLLAARDKLYLSHGARDEQNGEELEPSSVVAELLHMLRGYLTESAHGALRIEQPLRAYDPRYFPELFGLEVEPLANASPSARRQARALALRQDLERALGPVAAGERLARVDDAHRARVEEVICHVEPAPAGELPDVVELQIWMLRKFLDSPEQAWASAVVGLRETELDDAVAREDEPFELAGLEQAMLLRGVFLDHLRAGEDEAGLTERLHRQTRLMAMSGRGPVGVFGAVMNKRYEALLCRWRGELAALDGLAADWGRVSFGRTTERDGPVTLHPPILLEVNGDGRRVTVELYGNTGVVGPPELGSLELVANKAHLRHQLRAFVDHVVLAAAGLRDDQSHGALVLAGAGKSQRARFRPWSQADAIAYLTERTRELLFEAHDYLLPADKVVTALRKNAPISRTIAESIERKRERVAFGPLERLDRFGPPPEEAARRMAEARLGPYLEHLEEGG